MSLPPLMLDLFSGLGGASQAFEDAGWEVITVELEPSFKPDIVADLARWSWPGRRPALVWASPPCTEFSRESMPRCRTGRPPSLALVEAAQRIIRECAPDAWVIENVRGAIPCLNAMFGRYTHRAGPFFLWTGGVQPFKVDVPPFKEKLSSRDRAKRAKVPYAVSAAVLNAVRS